MDAVQLQSKFDLFNSASLERAREIVEEFPELLNFKDAEGWTLLSYQISYQRLNRVEILLQAGVSPNQHAGQISLLSTAVITDDEELISLMLNYGADPNIRDTGSGMTPIMHAAIQEYEIFELLLDHGADPAMKSNVGISALDQLGEPKAYWSAGQLRRYGLAKAAVVHNELNNVAAEAARQSDTVPRRRF